MWKKMLVGELEHITLCNKSFDMQILARNVCRHNLQPSDNP